MATTGVARADEKVACVTAAETAQQQRSEGKLRDARLSLHLCARDVCPALVRNDCTQWLTEIEASLPTIVLRATGPRGQDVTDIKVSLDGQAIADKVDGLPLEVDPGLHVLTAVRPGSKPVRQELTFYTNQRNRTVSLVLEDVDPPPGGTGELRVSTDSSAPKRVNALPYVFGAVAVGALGSFTYFGLTANREAKRLDETCGAHMPNGDGQGHCPSSDVSRVRTKLTVADISLGVAVVSAGISTWLFLKGSKPPTTTALPAREIFASPTPGGAAAFWIERF
jgi:hypothetical protein